MVRLVPCNRILSLSFLQTNNRKGHKLNTNEFYTELNVRGFDYGPQFKQIQQIEYANFDRSKAQVQWNKNWITFVESMIQLLVTHTTNRSIYVALNLSSLKCDPRVLFNSTKGSFLMSPIESFSVWNFLIDSFEVITDANLKCSVSCGIEIKGLKFANIPLRNVMKDVKMEKYEFVPFVEQCSIEDVDRQELLQYISICNGIAKRIEYAHSKSSLPPYNNPLFDYQLVNIMKRTVPDHQVFLKLMVTLYKMVFDENENILLNEPLTSHVVKQTILENDFDLSLDQLNNCSNNARLMRSTLGLSQNSKITFCSTCFVQMLSMKTVFVIWPSSKPTIRKNPS